MSWSNKVRRERLMLEKSHSVSLHVRVEDRLHRSIVKTGDKLFFTVRDELYKVGLDDADATLSLEAMQIQVNGAPVFHLIIQASEINLDPELEWFYDLTYMTDGFSVPLVSGQLEVAANPTNRGAGGVFAGAAGAYSLVATVQDRQLLRTTNNLPVAERGRDGLSAYTTTTSLTPTVGTVQTVPAETIDTSGRGVQVGDILYSKATEGVMAVVRSLTMEAALTEVTVEVVQVFGRDGMKALLDHTVRDMTIIELGHEWSIAKTSTPLPPGYLHQVGDLVFSQVTEEDRLDKYMVISQVESMTTPLLTLKTVIVFPMFADAGAIQSQFDSKVDKTQRVNGVALLYADNEMTADEIPDGTGKVVMTAAERSKLSGVETNATKNSSDNHLLKRTNHTGEQDIATVTGLQAALDGKPDSADIDLFWVGTQAMYDQIVTKNPRTIYLIRTV